MPKYLVQTAYTAESWGTMTGHPQDRNELVRPAIENVGGKLESGFLSFGEYDIVAVVDFPDNVSAAAFSISVAATGAVKAFKTTPLMTMDEAVAAMQKAGDSTYAPPS
ncbi:MAG: GYD domain-containing protein [Acidimicrobiia bacterium]